MCTVYIYFQAKITFASHLNEDSTVSASHMSLLWESKTFSSLLFSKVNVLLTMLKSNCCS